MNCVFLSEADMTFITWM